MAAGAYAPGRFCCGVLQGAGEPAVELRAIARRRAAYRPARFRWQGRSGCRNKDSFFTAFLYRSGRFVVAFCCRGRLRSFCGIPGRVFCFFLRRLSFGPVSPFDSRGGLRNGLRGAVCTGYFLCGFPLRAFCSGSFGPYYPSCPVCADCPQRAVRAAAVRFRGGKPSEG